MKNLFKFEFSKLFKRPLFYLCFSGPIILSIFHLIGDYNLHSFDSYYLEHLSANKIMIETFASEDSLFATFMCVFVAIFACADFSELTIKNIYSRGVSRAKEFFVKLAVILVGVVIMYVATFLTNYLLGYILYGNKNADSLHYDYVNILIAQFLSNIAFAVVIYTMSIIFKKMTLAVINAIVSPLIIWEILELLNRVVFNSGTPNATRDPFLPYESLNLNRYWFTDMASCITHQVFDDLNLFRQQILVACMTCVVYIIVFILIGYFVTQKREIK